MTQRDLYHRFDASNIMHLKDLRMEKEADALLSTVTVLAERVRDCTEDTDEYSEITSY